MLREGLKKKEIVEFSNKRWGDVSAWFSTKKKQNKKNMILKHWILPKDHFKTHLFFFQFFGGETVLSLDPGPKDVSNL